MKPGFFSDSADFANFKILSQQNHIDSPPSQHRKQSVVVVVGGGMKIVSSFEK